MRDVTLPNGVVLKNVPDDMSDFNVTRFAVDKGIAKPEDYNVRDDTYNPTDEMSVGGKVLAGVGGGLKGVALNTGNIFGAVEDDTVRENESLAEDLYKTKSGAVGRFAGEMLATAPLFAGTGGAGAAAAGASKLVKSAGALSRGARNLGAGAASGAVVSGPDDRAQATLLSGAAAGVLPLAAGVVKGPFNLLKSRIKLTPEYKEIANRTGAFIGVADAQEDGLVKSLFTKFGQNFPGMSRELRRQAAQNRDVDYYKLLAHTAYPKSLLKAGTFDDADDIYKMYQKLDGAWDKAYKPFNNVPLKFNAEAVQMTPAMREFMKKSPYFKDGVVLKDQSQLLRLKSEARRLSNDRKLYKNDPDLNEEINDWIRMDGVVDKTIMQNMNRIAGEAGKRGNAKLAKEMSEKASQYKDLREPYWMWQVMKDASDRAGQEAGTFTPKQAMKAAWQRSGKRKYSMDSDPLRMMKAAKDLWKEPPGRTNIFQIAAALSLPVAMLTPFGVPYAAALGGSLAAGRWLVRPNTQRALMGIEGKNAQSAARKRALRLLGYSAKDASAIAAERYVEAN